MDHDDIGFVVLFTVSIIINYQWLKFIIGTMCQFIVNIEWFICGEM